MKLPQKPIHSTNNGEPFRGKDVFCAPLPVGLSNGHHMTSNSQSVEIVSMFDGIIYLCKHIINSALFT